MTSFFEDHLSLDAVVAFADGEMGLTAYQRAAAHVARCQSCAVEVAEQTTARQQLRGAACPSIPSGLLDALRSIPIALPAAPPPAGISRDAMTGRAARTVRAVHGMSIGHEAETDRNPERGYVTRTRGFRLGAGAIVAGLAVGALAASAVAERSPGLTGPTATPDTAQVSYPEAPASSDVMVISIRSAR